MNTVSATIAALAVTGSALAQQQVATVPASTAWNLNWSFNEQIDIHTFKGAGSTLVGLNQNLSLDINKDFHIDLDVPVYTQADNTTISNLNLGGSWDMWKGSNDLLGAWGLNVGAGMYIPVGSEYFRNANVDPYVNATFNCKIWAFDFAQSADFRFVGGESYITWLGTKTNSDVVTLETNLSYSWNAFKFGLQFDQLYYINSGEQQLFLGPTVDWKVASNVDLSAGIGIPVYQNVISPEADAIVKAGLGIKF